MRRRLRRHARLVDNLLWRSCAVVPKSLTNRDCVRLKAKDEPAAAASCFSSSISHRFFCCVLSRILFYNAQDERSTSRRNPRARGTVELLPTPAGFSPPARPAFVDLIPPRSWQGSLLHRSLDVSLSLHSGETCRAAERGRALQLSWPTSEQTLFGWTGRMPPSRQTRSPGMSLGLRRRIYNHR